MSSASMHPVRRLRGAVSRLSFRAKILLGVSLIVLLLALPLALVVSRLAADALLDEGRKRGEILALALAVRATEPLLALDRLRLVNLVRETASSDADLRYVFVQRAGREGVASVMAHTFTGGFPVALAGLNADVRSETPAILLIDTGEELIYDVAAPVMSAGEFLGLARVGLSRSALAAPVAPLVGSIAATSGAALTLALILSVLFARGVTRRVNRLKHYADEVVTGNLHAAAARSPLSHCWEVLDCKMTNCPAHGDVERRCWYLAGNLVDTWADKLSATATAKGEEEHGAACCQSRTSCADCPVYKANRGDEIQDLAEAFEVMVLALNNHIEQLRQAEHDVSRQERLLRTILDVTPDLVCLLGPDLRYKAVNKAFAEFVGRSAASLPGLSDEDIFPPEVARERMERARLVLSMGHTSHAEDTAEDADGVARAFHVVTLPVLDSENRVLGVLRSERDISEVKRVQEQLIQSQKMESVGKLAGGVAHEINTPLGVILGYAQLLQEDVPEDSPLSRDLAAIERQAQVCRKIVADLLGFSRQAESAKLEMCFNNSLMEAVALVRHTFELDKVEIVTRLDDRMPIIYGDPDKLKQVWINLLNNGRDAIVHPKSPRAEGTAPGGAILVRSRLYAPQGKVVVWFSDTGEGIAKAEMERVFEPFYTTKPVGRGTGLGLSVSFGIIKDHDGVIAAESPALYEDFGTSPELCGAAAREVHLAALPEGASAGPGATFRVDLPLDHQQETETEDANGADTRS